MVLRDMHATLPFITLSIKDYRRCLLSPGRGMIPLSSHISNNTNKRQDYDNRSAKIWPWIIYLWMKTNRNARVKKIEIRIFSPVFLCFCPESGIESCFAFKKNVLHREDGYCTFNPGNFYNRLSTEILTEVPISHSLTLTDNFPFWSRWINWHLTDF